MLIPSIDIMNNKLVQLKQGKEKVIELDNPIEYAKKYSKLFQIQLIDLDAAFETGDNFQLIKEICKIAKCRVGGGIRTIEKAKEIIKSGAEKIIIGTNANKEFLSELIKNIGKEKIIIALDSIKGKVAIKGWKETTEKTAVMLAKELENYCSEFLYTCIDKEGLMEGYDIDTILELNKITKNKITIAGGISTLQDIIELDKINVDCVAGMAIYSGKLDPFNAYIELLDLRTAQYSCFDETKKFTLNDLYNKIKDRLKSDNTNSYTKRLINNPNELKRKLIEEAGEVITADSKENLIWECSDLIYFLFVIMAKENITFEDIEMENERRDKK